MSSTHHILMAALITEGLLVIVSYIVAGLFEVGVRWNASLSSLCVGALSAVPLLGLNHILWLWSTSHPESTFARFSRNVIIPLCKQVSPFLAIILGLLAGFGEELFFRGVLNNLTIRYFGPVLAAVFTSVLFAYVHFIGLVKTYAAMLPIYIGVGLFLWGVHAATDSLVAVMVTHATYNFCAMTWVRLLEKTTP